MCAAVAAAASSDAVGAAAGCGRYERWPRSIALTASYTAPCTIAKLNTAAGGGCPAVTTIAVDALAFQSVTVSARAGATDATSATADTAATAAARPQRFVITLTAP